MRRSQALERAFWKANRIGEHVDIYAVIYGYQALADASSEELEAMYDYLCHRLGFSSAPLTSAQEELLYAEGFLESLIREDGNDDTTK